MKLVCKENNHDDFLKARFISGNFLQSCMWRDFLSAQGKKYWQLSVVEDEKVLGVCLLYENKLPFDRSYLFSAKGPIISDDLSEEKQRDVLKTFLSQAREVTIETKKQEEIFFKFEPSDHQLLLPELEKSHDIHPRDTLVLDLGKDLKDLLADMHAKTRYNIALAAKKGVKISFSTEEKDIESFLKLYQKTAQRNDIRIHDSDHYRLLYKKMLEHQVGYLALAKVDGTAVAANLVIKFGQAVTYLHGASDYQYRKYMAPHLLQWETIKRAKEDGATIYDFWGIAPEDGSKSSWSGITRFKKGFAGRVVKSPGAYNLIYNKTWYSIYKLSRKLLRK